MSKMYPPQAVQENPPQMERAGDCLDFLRSRGAKVMSDGFYSGLATLIFLKGVNGQYKQ